jgi:hypothetical protein
MTEQNQMVITKQERPNSYEFGKAGNRFKLYFEDAKDLVKKIKELKECGFDMSDAYPDEE